MSRVALLCPDLLLGSKLEGSMRAAGHQVERYDGEDMARAAVDSVDVLVVDLGADEYDGAVLVESMRMGRELEGVPAVGFYPHVDVETRRRAVEAGYDVVVPRSKMARETAAVVEGALAA
jgi:DNA-binding response OmpR family regulator